jgi:hypothetical protein
VGTPARLVGYVCHCGRKMEQQGRTWHCQVHNWSFEPPGGDK